jgi:hypothetical protein
MLIDDQRVGEAQPGREIDAIGTRRESHRTAGNHVLGHNRRTGGGASDMHPGRVGAPDFLRHQGAAEDGRKPQLVTASHEYAGGAIQVLDVFRTVGVGTFGNRQGYRAGDTDFFEYLDIAVPGVGQHRRGRDDYDPRLAATAKLDETAQYAHRTGALFGAADGYHITAGLIFSMGGWAHLKLVVVIPRTGRSPVACRA